MTIHVALLRGINVGGHKQIAMAKLCELLTALGFAEARSLLQSGNLVFRSDGRTGAQLERLLETEVKKRLAVEADVFVRTAAEWDAIIARNPFRKEAERDPGHLVVMLFKDAPRAGDVEALRSAIKGPEVVHADGRQAYIVFPIGTGRSKLTHALIERRLGTRGTGRNWNTVLKLGALANA